MTLRALLSIVLPVVVFLGGADVMRRAVGRDEVTTQLAAKAQPEDQTPLNSRLLGYDLAAVDRYWGAMDAKAQGIERHFLQLDLAFPLFYGAALAAGLLLNWTAINRPFRVIYLLAPVLVTMVADWGENAALLSQLSRYMQDGAPSLTASLIRLASVATMVKLLCFTGSSAMIVWLAWRVVRLKPDTTYDIAPSG